jgi:co-chaperonin GroES (HSP10)
MEMKIRLMGPRLLVEMDDEEAFFKGYNSIIKPDSVHDSAQGWGKVLSLGTGTRLKDGSMAPIEGVRVGDRVAFVKFLKEAQTNKSVAALLGDDKIIIELRDILVVAPS